MHEQPITESTFRLHPDVRHGGVRYRGARDEPDLVDASASINPLGAPSWLHEEVSRWLSAVQHYPDPDCRDLVAAIAELHRCSPDQVVVGNGSSELLAWLPYVVGQDRWVVPVPSYGEYRRAAVLAEKELIEVPFSPAPGFDLSWEHLAKALTAPAVVLLGHPNNPTGKLIDPAPFNEHRAKYPKSLFVVDEAFGDFVEGFASVWDPAATNLIVLQSMTKMYAIPGLRLGYALTAPSLAAAWRRRIPPWSVNLIAQRVGLRALADRSHVSRTRTQVERLKKTLANCLRELPVLEVHVSKANWLLVRLRQGAPNALNVVERCLQQGVALRGCEDFWGLGERWIRISVRDEVGNERIVAALKQVVGNVRAQRASEREAGSQL